MLTPPPFPFLYFCGYSINSWESEEVNLFFLFSVLSRNFIFGRSDVSGSFIQILECQTLILLGITISKSPCVHRA